MSITEIRAEGLTVDGGGKPVVAGLDLHARAGEMLGITGPSGSGKTTLLYALGGLVAATGGSLLVDGRPAVLWRDASVGIVLQNLCLVPLLSAQETVACPCRPRGCPAMRWPAGRRPPWSDLVSATTPPTWSVTCPAASARGWRWPGRWPGPRAWSSPTNRPPPSTSTDAGWSWTCWWRRRVSGRWWSWHRATPTWSAFATSA